MINFSEYDKDFKVIVDTGFWPLYIVKKTLPMTAAEELTVSEAFERSKRTGEAFSCEEDSLKAAKLLKALNDELGREIDQYQPIAILNYGRKESIQYKGLDEDVKSAVHMANLVLGLIDNDLVDDVDLIGKSSYFLADELESVKSAQSN